MIGVEIPEKDIPIFQKLVNLTDKQFTEVLNAVKKLPVELSQSNLYDLLKETTIENAVVLTDIIFKTLISFVSQQDRPLKSFTKLLYNSFFT